MSSLEITVVVLTACIAVLALLAHVFRLRINTLQKHIDLLAVSGQASERRTSNRIDSLHNAVGVDIKEFKAILDDGIQWIKSVTTIDADVGYHQNAANTVIVMGRYKNRAYVQAFDMHDKDLAYIADMLQDMKRRGNVRHIDAPPGFKAVIDND